MLNFSAESELLSAWNMFFLQFVLVHFAPFQKILLYWEVQLYLQKCNIEKKGAEANHPNIFIREETGSLNGQGKCWNVLTLTRTERQWRAMPQWWRTLPTQSTSKSLKQFNWKCLELMQEVNTCLHFNNKLMILEHFRA